MLTELPSPIELRGAARGTLLYLGLYVVFLTCQSFSKHYLLRQKKKEAKQKGGRVSFKSVKYYNRDDALALVWDRAVGNFGEWAIVFLPLLWMHALFVDPQESFSLCLLCTVSRALYPLLFKHGVWLVFSTGPGYLVMAYMGVQLTIHLVFA